ncbi:MAG: gliding motility-associated ABC transporter permease subunit GldF [Bacteroidota bacterium]
MRAIIKKEMSAFFSAPEGYLIIAVFLLLNGFFLWIFKTNYNIFDAGFAELTAFFELVPWIFMFLIPAVTMKSFTEERKSGTLELLLTKPLGLRYIILGKFFGAFLLVFTALLPTLLYSVTLVKISMDKAIIDFGSIVASYFGLLFLTGAYSALGIFSSAITRHQTAAFIVAVCSCFLWYYGFEGIAELSAFDSFNSFLSNLGMKAHFNSMTRGVLDTRDMVYFLTVTLFFLFLTNVHFNFSNR